MNNYCAGIAFVGTYLLYSYYKSDINILQDLLVGKYKSKKITIDFFRELISKNPDITLDHAILKFENSEIDSLHEFAISKNRTVEGYRKAYENLFDLAKISKDLFG